MGDSRALGKLEGQQEEEISCEGRGHFVLGALKPAKGLGGNVQSDTASVSQTFRRENALKMWLQVSSA